MISLPLIRSVGIGRSFPLLLILLLVLMMSWFSLLPECTHWQTPLSFAYPHVPCRDSRPIPLPLHSDLIYRCCQQSGEDKLCLPRLVPLRLCVCFAPLHLLPCVRELLLVSRSHCTCSRISIRSTRFFLLLH